MENIAQIGHNNPPSEMEILEKRLRENYKEVQDSYDRLAQKPLPDEISDEQQAGQVTDYIKSVNALNKKVENIHKQEKAIYLDCGRVVDSWKKSYEGNLKALTAKASEPLNKFLADKAEAERNRQLELAKKAREEADKLATEALAHANEGIDDTANELLEAAIQSETKADMIYDNSIDVRASSRTASASATQKLVWTGEIESAAAIDLEVLRRYFKEDDFQRAINAAVRDGVREIRGVKIYQKAQISVR